MTRPRIKLTNAVTEYITQDSRIPSLPVNATPFFYAKNWHRPKRRSLHYLYQSHSGAHNTRVQAVWVAVEKRWLYITYCSYLACFLVMAVGDSLRGKVAIVTGEWRLLLYWSDPVEIFYSAVSFHRWCPISLTIRPRRHGKILTWIDKYIAGPVRWKCHESLILLWFLLYFEKPFMTRCRLRASWAIRAKTMSRQFILLGQKCDHSSH